MNRENKGVPEHESFGKPAERGNQVGGKKPPGAISFERMTGEQE